MSESSSDTYVSPFSDRYASKEMLRLFSSQFKYSTWRKLWIALAEVQQELGLAISNEQIEEMKKNQDSLNLDRAAAFEEQLQHDVMAHIHAFAEQCPLAKPIIHLGATSCYVTDNTDLIVMREGLEIIQAKLETLIAQLSAFAGEYASLTTLAYTHFQAAQPTTVGKRACLWIQDLLMDLDEVKHRIDAIPFLGAKGTTGTQASFLTLFKGDHNKVDLLDKKLAEKMQFDSVFPVSGQTYTRKLDTFILQTLSGIGASCHKFATDIRLLAHLKEIEEPFGDHQVGSSAMPYKRNPMLSERICSISRFLISLSQNPAYTHSTQWLERTLDDSANRRLTLPEAFLACDSILELMLKMTRGLVVYPKMVSKHIQDELPFLLTEAILMQSVAKGADRQAVHEQIRRHSQAAANQVKQLGKENDLLERIANDPLFKLTQEDLARLMQSEQISGRAEHQVAIFLDLLNRRNAP